ncbi:class IV [Micractinium conductrix]|uniref:Class IV n=1 Tax=Micractinium conductrix TaxID=554055 RepID=A0A2P6VR44_9CHLO|nr:class IV [Micractinium conductrix]|eukprot:PSC76550.1 class IV [Micractinium conductrix]
MTPSCLVKNEEVLPCALPSGAWLAAAPRGAYTTARTVGGGAAAFELGFHINRLASSAALMMQADAAAAGTQAAGPPAAPAAAAEAADAARLRPRVLAALRAAVRAYRAATAHSDGELKLTVLVTWPGSDRGQQAGGQAQPSSGSTDGASASDGASKSADAPPAAAAADVYVHVAPLPPRPAPPVRVVMRGQPRQNAAAKDSEWVRQRKAIEQELPPDVNEAVLVGADGALFEGLTSNVFAVMDGAVHTAGEGILAGSVREVVLQVARREGIPVVLEPPRLSDLPRWEGCMISSTSRLLLPVDEASVHPEAAAAAASSPLEGRSAPASRTFERGGVVGRLEQLVLAEIDACSEPLFD